MKRKLLSAVLCMSMAATLLAGCGGSGDEAADSGSGDAGASAPADTAAATPAPADTAAADTAAADTQSGGDAADPIASLIANTDGTVNIDLWCSEQENYQTVMASLVEDFKAEYPDIEFNITIGAVSEADAKDRVLEDVEAAADVFVFADDQLSDLVTAGALQSVDATFTYDVKSVNSEQTVQAASRDGKLYAYPLTASNGYFLYYNKEYFTDEDAASWESLLAKANEQGVKVGMDVGNAWYLYSFFAGAGLELSMNEDQSNNCDWNSTTNSPTGAEVAEAIQTIATDPAFISVGDTDSRAMYGQDLAAYVNGVWAVDDIKKAYGEDYGATKLPTFNAGGQDVQMGSFAGYKFVGVNSYAENPGWSMLLAEFISSESSQAKIAEATGEAPANTTAAAGVTSPAIAALSAQSEFADQQVVGPNFWDPAASLGTTLVEGGVTDFQGLLDTAVEGITQPSAQ